MRYVREEEWGWVMIRMVGAEGFEPPTLCSQSRCATRLRYAPTSVDCIATGGFIKDGVERASRVIQSRPKDERR